MCANFYHESTNECIRIILGVVSIVCDFLKEMG